MMWPTKELISGDREPSRLRIISLGAGVQSSCLFLMACLEEIERPDFAIFADTQSEPKKVYEQLDYLIDQGKKYGIDIHVVTAGNLGHDVINSLGDSKVGRVGQPPFFVKGPLDRKNKVGKLWRKCTAEYKIKRIQNEMREYLVQDGKKRVKKGDYGEQWIGFSLDEIGRVKGPSKYDPKWSRKLFPLIDMRMTRHDCKLWMSDRGFKMPPKSACIFCPFRTDAEWRRMKIEDPEEFDEVVSFDKKIRTGIPGVRGKAYIHRSCRPIGEIDFSNSEDNGQNTMFPCEEGYCGT